MAKVQMSEEKIVEFVNSRVQSSKDGAARTKFMKNFEVYRRAYNGEFKNKLPKQYSQFFIRMAFQTIDTMMAYFYESMFNSYPIATFAGRFSEDSVKGKSMQHIMDYEMYHRNYIDRSLTALNWVLKYGINVTFSYWRYGIGKRKRADFNEILPGVKSRSTVEESYVKYDNPSFKIIDPRRFYPDHNAGCLETENGTNTEMNYAAHEEFTNFSTLVKDAVSKHYFNLDKVFKDVGYDPRKDDIFNFTNSNSPSEDEDATDDYRKRVKLTHYWGTIDVKVSGTSPNSYTPGNYDSQIYWIIIANEKHLIHFKANPYYHNELPYQIGNLYKDDDSLYGMSAIETVLSSQDIMNVLVNLRLDNIHNLVVPSPTVWKGGLEDKDHFEKRVPGEPAYVSFPEDLNRIINYPRQADVGGAPYNQMMNQMRTEAMSNSAANPESMGMHPKSNRSAREVSAVTGAGMVRFKKMGFVYANTWVQPTLQQWVQLIQQFATTDRMGKIMGQRNESYVQYTPEEIQGAFDVEVMDATVGNMELVSQAYTNLLAAMAPYAQTGQIDAVPLLEGVLENMPLIRNPEEIIKRAMSLSKEEMTVVQQLAPDVMAQIMQARQEKQGVSREVTKGTPGTGQNGGRQSMGTQSGTPGGGVKVAM